MMKHAFKELMISAAVGLGLGLVVLGLSSQGWFVLPLSPDKKPLFLLGTTAFSALFRSLALVGGSKPTDLPVDLKEG